MPKFLVKMNYVEAKNTSFVIQANNEDDVHDALGELDFTFFEKNCNWTTTEYEPPVIEDVEETKNGLGFCDASKNKKIQTKFDKIVAKFNKLEKKER